MSSTVSIDPEVLQPIVGAKLLELLGEETRNKLLCEAVKSAVDGWEARKAVAETVAAAVREFTTRILGEPEILARLEAAARDGIDNLILGLPDRIQAILKN